MYWREISVILMVFLFISCDGIVNEKEKQELNNEVDQAKVDRLLTDVAKENYSNRISDLATIYGDRVKIVSLNSDNSDYVINKVYEVWPSKSEVDRFEALSSLKTDLKRYRSEAKRLRAKGQNISAFDVLLQSEKADTNFSKIEKRFLQETQEIFDTKNKQASFYVSELDRLEKEYQTTYDLTDKEFATIVGISKSLSGFIGTLDKFKYQASSLSHPNRNINIAGIVTSALLLQTGQMDCGDPQEAIEHYTGPNGEFAPDLSAIGLSSTLAATLGMTGYTARMGYYALAGAVFPAGSATAAAIDFAVTGVSGAVSGATGELVRQLSVHREYFSKHCENEDENLFYQKEN